MSLRLYVVLFLSLNYIVILSLSHLSNPSAERDVAQWLECCALRCRGLPLFETCSFRSPLDAGFLPSQSWDIISMLCYRAVPWQGASPSNASLDLVKISRIIPGRIEMTMYTMS